MSAAPSSVAALPDVALLLAWYDRHRRDLPWRARPGDKADPYRVWLSEIMLQQTTVAAVKPYFAAFLTRFPTVAALAAAPSEAVMSAWAGLGYYSRARNLHACAKVVVAEHGGRFPCDEASLRRLPGIGAYTSAAIAAIAFGKVAAAVDGNVARVFSRIMALEQPLPGALQTIRNAVLSMVPADRPGDFAQALMDLGATICTPRQPACALCPWQPGCAAARAGSQAAFPRKTPKRDGAPRYGTAFVMRRDDGAILLRTRPAKGLLGGMSEVPTTAWTAGGCLPRLDEAPVAACWRIANAPVRHVFTHFPLHLTVCAAPWPADARVPEGHRFVAGMALTHEPLPAVMRKVIAAGLALLCAGENSSQP